MYSFVLVEPLDLEECQKQLRTIYNAMSKVKIVPWDQSSAVHIDEIYTQLSWLMDDRKPSGVTQERLRDYTEIFSSRKHYPKPKRILVYGRPGIGKTVFTQKTTFDWSKQRKEMLTAFDLVVLVKLRDVCGLGDVPAILEASELLATDGVISVDSLHDYILHNEEKVLLILDGYDEYSTGTQHSPVRDIWERKQLRDCCVVLTTRQMDVDELKRPSDAQFEINGFDSEHQIKKFALNFLKDERDFEEFYKYLTGQKLKDMAEIPLLLLMLCLLWIEKDRRGLPTSRASLYAQFIQTLLDHMSAKDADAKVFKNVGDYSVELSKLGKLAFDALLQDSLSFPLSELPGDLLIKGLIEVGLFQVLKLSRLNPDKGVFFIHKSVQEFLAGWYLKEELLSRKGEKASLSTMDSIERIIKMSEVLKFASELSGEAASAVLSHMGMVAKKEGLTEYNFMEPCSLRVFTGEQIDFLKVITRIFFCCSPGMRQDLFSAFLSYVGGVLLISPDQQLHCIADEHLLISTTLPNYIFFSDPAANHPEQGCGDLITVLEDLNAVLVSSSGEKKAADFLKKYQFRHLSDIFLKKEENMHLYLRKIKFGFDDNYFIEMLRELSASPVSTQEKKPDGDQSSEQDNRTAFTENSACICCPTHHCLSLVSLILAVGVDGPLVEVLTEVLPLVTSPRWIDIFGVVMYAFDAQLTETLVSRINFTDRLENLRLQGINLTAKSTATIATSLYQSPNLRGLWLSRNPLGEGVSVLTQHFSCVPHLQSLNLNFVKMTKKQVDDLTRAVRQSKIISFWSSYHVSFPIFIAICFFCSFICRIHVYITRQLFLLVFVYLFCSIKREIYFK